MNKIQNDANLELRTDICAHAHLKYSSIKEHMKRNKIFQNYMILRNEKTKLRENFGKIGTQEIDEKLVEWLSETALRKRERYNVETSGSTWVYREVKKYNQIKESKRWTTSKYKACKKDDNKQYWSHCSTCNLLANWFAMKNYQFRLKAAKIRLRTREAIPEREREGKRVRG